MEFIYKIYENVAINHSLRSFFIIAGLSIIFYRIPFFDKLLRTFHTIIHETGHALASILTSGKIHRIELHPDMSGLTITESNSKFKQFIISISGYPFASAFAYSSFLLIFNNKLNYLNIILIIIIMWQVLFNIRNFYGIIWSLTVAILLFFEFYKIPQLMWLTGIIISSITLFESMFMAGKIFIISIKNPQNAGDTSNLYKTTKIHSALWGFLFFAQAIFFVVITIKAFFEWI